MGKICIMIFVGAASCFFGYVGLAVLRGIIIYHAHFGQYWKLILSVPFIGLCFALFGYGVAAIILEAPLKLLRPALLLLALALLVIIGVVAIVERCERNIKTETVMIQDDFKPGAYKVMKDRRLP